MADTITHARVLKISVPIVISNATVPLMGIVDTGVVGQSAQAAPIAAVAAGAITLSAVYWIFGFLRMGTAGLAAQATGAGDRVEVGALLMRVLLIGFGAGVVMIATQWAIMAGAFAISPAEPEVEALARSYIGIRVWSAPAAIALYGITGWLVAQERTDQVMVLQIWMNGANIALSYGLGYMLDFGVPGVAWATFMAEWSGLALGLWFCRGAFRVPGWATPARIFDRARLINMASVNSDIMIRSVLLQIAFTSFILVHSAQLGTVPLAANQILLQFLFVTSYAMDGFAFAAEALVGKAFGAGNPARVRRATLMTSFWGVITVTLLAVIFAIMGPWGIEVLTKSPEVQAEARRYLPWVIAGPLIGCASWMFDGVFIGATRSRDMRNMMVLSFLLYFAAVYVLLPYGNHGLWAALMIFFGARGITLGLRYPALERAAGRAA
ncbi:MATE family efflux transporter [Thalassobacter stenotrophicus]|uniref:DNA-damage-inducible protein F n=2 Tax=Thalassobacter stenotrophicus TaxID=266809 RepID=A0A0P1F194_9RHOB|nr:MATE family efflux transporter [Thalassobacter stenotrophicus]PVZ48281.1 MATE family efflux transporter [Thalassobacter stenotrophicus]CUH61173.1 DNA-damage-inducible protein F [Thalassobacter stenotrophicus]SHI58727.1 multidrug resistance protein, MATE family [Thalassobacter stenotrophicus DSM 16310]